MQKTGIKWGYIILGLIFIAIGACFIAFNNSLKYLAITIGVILALFGAIYGTLTIANKSRSSSFAIKIVFSIICLAAGITTAVFNEDTVDILVALFSLLLIVDGSFKLNTAAMAKRYSVRGWWIMMLISFLIICSAFVLARYTPADIAKATFILGAIVEVDAIANIASALWVTKYESAQRANIYYEAHKSEAEEASQNE